MLLYSFLTYTYTYIYIYIYIWNTKIVTWSLNFKLENMTWNYNFNCALVIFFFSWWINLPKLLLALKSRWLERSHFILFCFWWRPERIWTWMILFSLPTNEKRLFLDHGAFHSKCCKMNKKDLVKQVIFVYSWHA